MELFLVKPILLMEDYSKEWSGPDFRNFFIEKGKKKLSTKPSNMKMGDLVITGSPNTRPDPVTATVFALKSSAIYSSSYTFDEKNHYSIE